MISAVVIDNVAKSSSDASVNCIRQARCSICVDMIFNCINEEPRRTDALQIDFDTADRHTAAPLTNQGAFTLPRLRS